MANMTAPAYNNNSNNTPAMYGQEKQMIQVPVSMAVPTPDYVYEVDAIKATYPRYVILDIKASPANLQNPHELSSRGLADQRYIDVVKQVKKIKSKSNTNKAFLWTGCIFCCGIIGWLLVDRRSVGNKKLSKQLAPLLQQVNQELGTNNIFVRFAWVEGTLRGYYR